MLQVFRIPVGIFLYLLFWEIISLISFIIVGCALSPMASNNENAVGFSISLLTLSGGWLFFFVPYIAIFSIAHCVLLEVVIKKKTKALLFVSVLFGIICGIVQWLIVILYLWEGARFYIGIPALMASIFTGYLIGLTYNKVLLWS